MATSKILEVFHNYLQVSHYRYFQFWIMVVCHIYNDIISLIFPQNLTVSSFFSGTPGSTLLKSFCNIYKYWSITFLLCKYVVLWLRKSTVVLYVFSSCEIYTEIFLFWLDIFCNKTYYSFLHFNNFTGTGWKMKVKIISV